MLLCAPRERAGAPVTQAGDRGTPPPPAPLQVSWRPGGQLSVRAGKVAARPEGPTPAAGVFIATAEDSGLVVSGPEGLTGGRAHEGSRVERGRRSGRRPRLHVAFGR